MISKDTSQNQDELIAFVKDPENIKKAIEGSMDKRIAVQASADAELFNDNFGEWLQAYGVVIADRTPQREFENHGFRANIDLNVFKTGLLAWRDKTRPLPSLPMINDAWCIACGNQTLFLGDGGLITCSWISCPDPSASYEAIKSMDVKSGDHGQDQGTDMIAADSRATEGMANPRKDTGVDTKLSTSIIGNGKSQITPVNLLSSNSAAPNSRERELSERFAAIHVKHEQIESELWKLLDDRAKYNKRVRVNVEAVAQTKSPAEWTEPVSGKKLLNEGAVAQQIEAAVREKQAQIDLIKKQTHKLNAGLIAVDFYLNKPYPDDPRWTPWTRFIGPRLKMLSKAVFNNEKIGELAAMTPPEPPQKDNQ